MLTEATTTRRGLPDEKEIAAISRHSAGTNFRWSIQGHNVNSWCQIPGNPFMGGFVLQPNTPGRDPVSVVYGPVLLPASFDTATVFLTCRGRPHTNVLKLRTQVLDGSLGVLSEADVLIRHEGDEVVTLRFEPPQSRHVGLRFTASFDDFSAGPIYGNIRLPYIVVYNNNPLVELFNVFGSDKGTEVFFGGGVPHCYALDYHRILEPLRHEAFNMLEIGLENASKEDSQARDAPSLRAWREYFPQASLFGFDINDFSFFAQERTTTYQGDQSSPDDLARFLEGAGNPRFRVILDDGSHASSHQQISLAKLFDAVEPGGLYIIEDLHWQPFDEVATTLQMLVSYLDTGTVSSPFINAADAQRLQDSIAEVRIYKSNDAEFAVVRKRA